MNNTWRHSPAIIMAMLLLPSPFIASAASTGSQSEESVQNLASEITRTAGMNSGLIIHLGCGGGELIAALANTGKCVVQGLDSDPANVERARRLLHSESLNGRVSARLLQGSRLPYADNLINLIVVEERGDLALEEIMRVLAPRGVTLSKNGGVWAKRVKPWPRQIDEWTHFLHGPNGNAVAEDRVVGPPKHYQWISEPLWMRSHESDSSVKALVTAKGRLFSIVDEAPTSLPGDHSLPDKWFLTAQDAFNGLTLWKIPIEKWGWRQWKPSWFTPRPGNIPLNIQKCLVAIDDTVYVTLGYHDVVSAVDARTGKVIRRYPGTEGTAEILCHSGRLILTVLQDGHAKVVTIDAEKASPLWTSAHSYGGTVTDYYRFRAMHGSVTPAKVDPTLNTATDGKVVALLDGADVVALDFKTGREKWRTEFPLVQADYKAGNINAQKTTWVGTLIVKDGVVVHASPNQLAAFSADSGDILWKQPKKYLQHLWFEWKDVFVINGMVWTWSAELERGRLEGTKQNSAWPATVNGYDLHTGELTKSVPLGNIFKTHHHHRCYRNKATTRYILASRRGTEFVDLENGNHTVHNWVRGICHLGMMPANGLQYAPPHPCVCYIDEKLKGFNALAPAGSEESASPQIQDKDRLERGRAFARPGGPAAGKDDWPTFRHDSARSGHTSSSISPRLQQVWQEYVGDDLAPPIVVGDHLYLPLTDTHMLMAISTASGKRQWDFTAGARIDSPPTYYRGMLVFGSADGSVYCLNAEDGQLAWRFHAAPQDRFIGAFGQLESAWPVHGSTLVADGVVYFAAGRSSQLDDGIYLYGLDALTGETRYTNRLHGPDYTVHNISQNYALPMGSLPDIMQAEGNLIRMRELTFDAKLRPVKPRSAQGAKHLYSKAGLLDDSYFKRAPWTFGSNDSYARLIVHDENSTYGIRMFDSLRGLDPNVYFVPGDKGYLLFAMDKQSGKHNWQKRIPIRVNAMVATADTLFVAGPPDIVDPNDPLGSFDGRKGGVLAAFDKATGEMLRRLPLSSPPVFNAMAAARGRLYIVMQDGNVTCFGP